MDISTYIESGILQDYCLGVLTGAEKESVEDICRQHPEVLEALTQLQVAFETLVTDRPVWAKSAMKSRIWDTINNVNIEEQQDPARLPTINKYSDHYNWLGIVGNLLPKQFRPGRFCKVIRDDGGVIQLLVKSSTDFEEEMHGDLRESFIVLEGECECTIGNSVISLKPGGYIEIPLHVAHNVKLLTPTITAIIQRVAV